MVRAFKAACCADSALTIASSIFRSLSLGIPGPLALLHGFAELSIGEQDECPTPHESGTSNKATAPAGPAFAAAPVSANSGLNPAITRTSPLGQKRTSLN